MAKPISAGLVIYKGAPENLELLLVHPGGPFFLKKDDGVWSFPKGEVHDQTDSDFLSDAIREATEETGHNFKKYDRSQFTSLGSVTQRTGKIIHGWALKAELSGPFKSNTFSLEWPPKSGQTQDFPEVDKWAYFPAESAKQKLSGSQSEFIDRLISQLNQ